MPSLNDMNETYISAGLMFTDTSLWAGNVKLIARRGESFTPVRSYFSHIMVLIGLWVTV